MPIYKNITGQKIAVYAFDPTVTPGSDPAKTGDAANITAQISEDGGASVATDDINPTELDAIDHPGIYIFNLLKAETNADIIVISPVSSTSNILFDPVQILTLPGNNVALPSNIKQINDASTAAENLRFAFDGTGYAGLFENGVITESYADDTVAPTVAQILYRIMQNITEFGIVNTTLTVKKLDKLTVAETYTLDDVDDPTSRTRAT